ncbi:MAG: glycosyltransferase family 4 protein [Burkholderiales bacterium]|nr:glycosyltransferase family 4 protein [Burkholderiales bacterium]
MTGPRIALVRQRYNAAGGAERFVARAMEALRRDGAQITLVTRRWEAEAGTEGIVTLDPFHLGRTWRDWSFARAVCRHVRENRYDLVQSHERIACCDVYRAGDGVHREWLLQRGRVVGPLRRASLWANPHHRYVLAREREVFASPRVRAVICISRMNREEIMRHYGTPERKLPVVYLGVDLDHFHPTQRERLRTAQRAALGIGESDLTVVYVGSGFERKGVATLLRAVARSTVPCHAIVVGGDKHASRYEALAGELGIAARVRFVGVQKDARPWYAAGDVFVMPSLYEPFGNANMEALAMGLPVITSTKSGVAELLEPGVSGYVHDALDADGVAASVAALADREHRESMGRAARKVAEGYSLEAMSRQLLDLYARLLAPSSV